MTAVVRRWAWCVLRGGFGLRRYGRRTRKNKWMSWMRVCGRARVTFGRKEGGGRGWGKKM